MMTAFTGDVVGKSYEFALQKFLDPSVRLTYLGEEVAPTALVSGEVDFGLLTPIAGAEIKAQLSGLTAVTPTGIVTT